jgi:hypothetical protein
MKTMHFPDEKPYWSKFRADEIFATPLWDDAFRDRMRNYMLNQIPVNFRAVANFGLREPWTGLSAAWETEPQMFSEDRRSIYHTHAVNYPDGAPVGDRPLMEHKFGIFKKIFNGMNLFCFVIVP